MKGVNAGRMNVIQQYQWWQEWCEYCELTRQAIGTERLLYMTCLHKYVTQEPKYARRGFTAFAHHCSAGRHLFPVGFSLDLFFDPEVGGSSFLRNVSGLPSDSTALHPRKQYSFCLVYFVLLLMLTVNREVYVSILWQAVSVSLSLLQALL
jgi:hypothetical protein